MGGKVVERAAFAARLLVMPVLVSGPAAAAMPDPVRRDATRVAVLCSDIIDNALDHQQVAHRLCDSVVRLAKSGAPVSVEMVGLGDAAPAAPGSIGADAVDDALWASLSQTLPWLPRADTYQRTQ